MYATAITQRLSMDDVLSRGRFVEFDLDDLLEHSDMAETPIEPAVSTPSETESA
jgi:hypothetical protein